MSWPKHRNRSCSTGQARNIAVVHEESGRKNIPLLRAVIGLGNPGKDYGDTYHNAGLNAIDWLRKNYLDAETASPKTVKGFFQYYKERGLTWIKPSVFMNESGVAVKQALQYFNLRPEEILIIHDDSDLEIGRVRLSWNRGSAGHKGIESVIAHLGTKKLWRLRIGIRKAGKREKASEFVLRKVRQSDKKTLQGAFKNAAEIMGLVSR